jgi:glutaredoxin
MLYKVCLLLLLFSPLSLQADVVRYVDKQGNLHYVEGLDKVPEPYREQAKSGQTLPGIMRYKEADRPVAPSSGQSKSTVSRSKPSKLMEVYVTTWCPSCRALEAFLKQKNITYARYDIERNRTARNTYHSLGGNSVPLSRIGSQVIQGFNPDAILRALGR